MDDLKMLGDLLAKPGPSRDVVDRGRHRLRETMRGTARRHPARTRWLAAGTGLTAAAAAGAVAITLGTTVPAATPRNHPDAGQSGQSGQQILLAAAVTAERAPAGSGTYWHVTTVVSDSPSDYWQTWATRDGQNWWTKEGSDEAIKGWPGQDPFMLAGVNLTFWQLQDLPTGVAALKAWVISNTAKHGSKGGPPEREAVFDALTSLISEQPAPPKLRAAAFRVLASLPGVKSLGPVRGGQGLLFSFIGNQQARLVIDPVTSLVRDTNFLVMDGADGELWTQSPTTATVTAEWTNRPPTQTVPAGR
jgi:hypothetical protein